MRFGLWAAALAVLTATTAPAAGQDRPALAPSEPWAIDYDLDNCALIRTFGTDEDRVILEIRRFAPGWGLQTTVASNRLGAPVRSRVSYRFNDDEDWQQPGLGLPVTLDSGLKGVIMEPSFVDLPELEAIEDPEKRAAFFQSLEFRAIERQQAEAINSIRLRGVGREFTLALGKFGAPIRALQDCVDELTTHWNIDVEAHRTLTRRARPIDVASSARMVSYPPQMARRRMPGLVNVRLSVDATGKVTGCSIQMPLSDPAFEESSCADIQHAFEFEPALDKDGHPIVSYWITRVIFTP